MSNKKKIIFILVLLAITAGLVLMNFYIASEQRRAEIAQGAGEFSLSPELVGENIYKLDMTFKTGRESDLRTISVLSFKLDYPNDNQEVEVVNPEGIRSSIIYPNEELGEDWVFPVNFVRSDEKGVSIQFAAVNVTPSGFTSSQYTKLATIYLKSSKPLNKDEFVLSVDPTETVMMSKTKPATNIFNTAGELFFSVN